MKLLNFSPGTILDHELKPISNGYVNHKVNRGFVYQWYEEAPPTPRISARAREVMSWSFLGKFSSSGTYEIGSGWYCTEVTTASGKPSGVVFSMNLGTSNTVTVEAFVRHLRESSPLSVLSSFAFNMSPKINVVTNIDGTTNLTSILPADRGILLDVSSDQTPDGVVVDWKNGVFYVDPQLDPSSIVIGRTALTLAGLREK